MELARLLHYPTISAALADTAGLPIQDGAVRFKGGPQPLAPFQPPSHLRAMVDSIVLSTMQNDHEPPSPDTTTNNASQFQINQKYARAFTSRKEKEELRRVRFERGGDSDDDGSTSSSSDEDEDAALLTPQLDVTIFQTLRALRRRDPSVYDPQVHFF